MKRCVLLFISFLAITNVHADVQFEKDKYKITIYDIINWYQADLGLKNTPAGVDKYPISEGNSRGFLYDGELRGWAQVYFPNGRLKRKLYFNPEFSKEKNGQVKGKSFDYFYYGGDTYASFGNGTAYPMFWLKNGKPYDGLLMLGHPSKNASTSNGELDSPYGSEGVWMKLYVKNGLANGIAQLPAFITTDTGKFKNGFKNGLWDRKSKFDFDKDGINDHLVTKYDLGKEIETIDKIKEVKDRLN